MPPAKTKASSAQPPAKTHPGKAPPLAAIGGVFLGFIVVSLLLQRMFRPRTPLDWAEPAPLPKDGKLGSFQIGPLLADGGTATVYSGQDPSGLSVAIKIPHRGPLRNRAFVSTFETEAQIGVDLRHPSIVRVLHAGTYKAPGFRKVPYFVMEYLEGQELDAVLRQGRLSQAEAINVARGVADALGWAHARGVIHRDISPRNIFVTSKRSVKVMDFGISTVQERGGRGSRSRGLAYGTPDYMAPERLSDSKAADERGDLYALGCVLYEMLAGKPPFHADTPEKILTKQRKAPIPSLFEQDLASRELDYIVTRLLAKNPADRFQSASEVTAKLADLLPHVV